MKNLKLRSALKERGIYLWQLAKILGISEATMCRKMREEMSEAEVNRIIFLLDNAEDKDGGDS